MVLWVSYLRGARGSSVVRAFCHGVMGLLSKGARGSSVVRAFCHGADGSPV